MNFGGNLVGFHLPVVPANRNEKRFVSPGATPGGFKLPSEATKMDQKPSSGLLSELPPSVLVNRRYGQSAWSCQSLSAY